MFGHAGDVFQLSNALLQCGNPIFELPNGNVANIRCSAKGLGLIARASPGLIVSSAKSAPRRRRDRCHQARHRLGCVRGAEPGRPMFQPKFQIFAGEMRQFVCIVHHRSLSQKQIFLRREEHPLQSTPRAAYSATLNC